MFFHSEELKICVSLRFFTLQLVEAQCIEFRYVYTLTVNCEQKLNCCSFNYLSVSNKLMINLTNP